MHAIRRRRVARRHFTSMMLLTKVGTTRYYPPRRPTRFEPSLIELNGIL